MTSTCKSTIVQFMVILFFLFSTAFSITAEETIFQQTKKTGEPIFQTTKEEMIKKLTKSKTPVHTRSIKANNKKKRSIVVVVNKNNEIKEKVIMVTENEEDPGLKLKVEFDYNSAALRPSSRPVLSELGRALTSIDLHDAAILIKGHTDSDGSETYNRSLSLNRAYSVKTYLVKYFNISEKRLTITGYGEAMPLKANTTPSNKQINRRVEIQIN